MNESKKLTEGAILSAIFIVLLIATFYIPFLSIISVFVLPVPFVIYTAKYGIKPALVMFAVAILLSMMLMTIFSLPIVLLVGLGGMAIGMAIDAKKEPYETWAQGTVGFSLSLAIIYVVTQFIFELNWVDEFVLLMEDSLQTTVSMFDQFGAGISQEEVEAIEAMMRELIYLIPTGIVLIGIILAFLSQWISYQVINRLEGTNYSFPAFRQFRLPSSVIWIFLLGIILTWIYTDPADTMYLAAVNLYTLPGLLIVLQGLSFIFFFTYYKNWSKAIPIITVIFFILFPFLLLYPLRILGIIDLGFQLRDRLTDKG
ncbi:YybS family protein [Alkalibacillus aidingensis]|uniref:YybS family protein n=1 Tax=Alkalibacillus aidingensis TaxID=2747607 RepID=UPI0016603F64|nr:YybS family protein [Alkalibacillus aidingensis]